MICFGKCTVYHWRIKSKHFFLPVLLRHNWHPAPCKSRCAVQWSDLHTSWNDRHRTLVNVISCRYKIKETKTFLSWWELLWVTLWTAFVLAHSHADCPSRCTSRPWHALYLITRSEHLLSAFAQLPPASGNQESSLSFCELACFGV